jgi:hypothetical protein
VRILSVQSIKPATDKELPTKSKLSKPKFKDKNFLKRYFNQLNNFGTGQILMMSPLRPSPGGWVNAPTVLEVRAVCWSSILSKFAIACSY